MAVGINARTGKPIKRDWSTNAKRAQRINSCLNKAIRTWLDNTNSYKRVVHWQKILINLYGRDD